ncbi:hypothetical protein LSM04_003072 [Trypanosoma melophagium]|uniref:uncharacterized protein n=1 Tax=Trypanosoma melophagium TaxID=715481 RepID=UPI00351A1B9F|nr:hypothetical protein LSM04_002165 [Trypanosoma melophagium]KAH9598085.1 hypothetical protein LSM04_003072 [Trypanosoma melophagium]
MHLRTRFTLGFPQMLFEACDGDIAVVRPRARSASTLSDVTEKVNVFLKETKREMKMNAADINYVERKEDEARELVNTVIERVQQVKEAVSKANSAADTAFTAANKLMKVASVIYNISAVFVRSAGGTEKSLGTREEKSLRAKESSVKITEAEKFASVLHSLVKTARTETLIAEREVESAVQVTKLVEEAIQNLRSAALKASEKRKT